jgi:hypothetical protein
MGDANHFTNAQRFALPTVIQMTALRAFSISKSPLLFHAVTTYSDNSANGLAKFVLKNFLGQLLYRFQMKNKFPQSSVSGKAMM